MLDEYLRMLAGTAPGARLLEIRFALRRGDMGRLFIAAYGGPAAVRLVRRLGNRTDVYVGVCLRSRRSGGRGAIDRAHLAFVDLDKRDALDRLDAFPHPPTMTVSSGTPGHAHAYWRLRDTIDVAGLERVTRKLAYHLGGDLASTDAPRILRPPGTLNHKYTPPVAVGLISSHRDAAYDSDELTAGLHDPADDCEHTAAPPATGGTEFDRALCAIPTTAYVRALTGSTANRAGKIRCPFHDLSVGEATAGAVMPARSHADASSRDRVSADPLLLVPPPVYFERLTGLRVGRSGKLRCLFHDDRHPSLHVYQEAGRGWYCFGCGRGGSVYDLAALLWGRNTRGGDFVELRRELEKLLLL
jgi:hypothetical protein